MRRLLLVPAWVALLGTGLVACTNVDLMPSDDGGGGAGGNQGTTLPGPDMTLVSFASDTLAMRIVILGADGAVPAAVQVQGTNNDTGRVDTTTATEAGAFVLSLADSHPGEDVSLTLEDESGDHSEPVNVQLDTTASDELPIPVEVRATVGIETPGVVTVSGVIQTTALLNARIANRTTGRVDHAEPDAGLDNRPFTLQVPGELGHVFLVSVYDPAQPAVTGRYVEVTASPL